jgi:hypothetical protein
MRSQTEWHTSARLRKPVFESSKLTKVFHPGEKNKALVKWDEIFEARLAWLNDHDHSLHRLKLKFDETDKTCSKHFCMTEYEIPFIYKFEMLLNRTLVFRWGGPPHPFGSKTRSALVGRKRQNMETTKLSSRMSYSDGNYRKSGLNKNLIWISLALGFSKFAVKSFFFTSAEVSDKGLAPNCRWAANRKMQIWTKRFKNK